MVDSFVDYFLTGITTTKDALDYYTSNTPNFKSVEIGPVQINELDYPCVHVIPDRADYQSDGEHRIILTVNYYFERPVKSYSFTDDLEDVEATLDRIFSELHNKNLIVNRELEGIDFYIGELGQKSLNIISVDIAYSQLFNWKG